MDDQFDKHLNHSSLENVPLVEGFGDMFSPQSQNHVTTSESALWESLGDALPKGWLASMEVVRSRVRPIHWQIFEAYLMENNSSRQVARKFQTSPNNVRIIAYRIRKQLQARHDLLIDDKNKQGDVSQPPNPFEVTGMDENNRAAFSGS